MEQPYDQTLLEADDRFGFRTNYLLQKLIDAEKKICLTFLEYVFNSEIKPITREARVAAAQATIFALERQTKKNFIEFVLTEVQRQGVEELIKKNYQSYSQTNISPSSTG
jgi:type I restriction enzyme R subunit